MADVSAGGSLKEIFRARAVDAFVAVEFAESKPNSNEVHAARIGQFPDGLRLSNFVFLKFSRSISEEPRGDRELLCEIHGT